MAESQLNSIHVDQSDVRSPSGEFNLMMFNALPSCSSSTNSDLAVAADHRNQQQSKRQSKQPLPRIPFALFGQTSSPPSASPPPPQQLEQLSSASPNHQSVEWIPHQRNGLILGGRRHRPVVRTQSSRVSLLRQPPHSASSLASDSGNEMEHFPMPDK